MVKNCLVRRRAVVHLRTASRWRGPWELVNDDGMQIRADLSGVTIELKNKGISLAIADNQGNHRGDLRIGQATGEWMKGKTREGNGIKFSIEELIDLLESLDD